MADERIERRPVDEARLAQLRALFPEVFTDGRVDPERLRALLGDAAVPEPSPGDEHYGLRWPGKVAARKRASLPPSGTLRPAPGEGVAEDSTENMLLVGDNLEVLRLLQKSYAGKVKLIYIDPPYNTGNDFIYKDDFREPVEAYLEATGQADMGGLVVSNPESSGRFHSNWLSMMYPRLMTARELLADDGAIFISIDDHEVYNLRLLMDEVFGSESFVASSIWEKKYARQNDSGTVSVSHDYLLIYAKSLAEWQVGRLPRTQSQLKGYKNPDDDPRGLWQSVVYTCNKTRTERPNLYYPIKNPFSGVDVWPSEDRVWAYDEDRTARHLAENRLWWGSDGQLDKPRLKSFLSEVGEGVVPTTLWFRKDVGDTQESAREVVRHFGRFVFNTPKPVRLIQQCLRVGNCEDGDLVLDFFAGSGTTGEAVMRLNAEDGGNRRFILVQLPEPTKDPQYPTIADITAARLKAAAHAIGDEQAQLELGEARPLDLGFRVFHLDRSNLLRWSGGVHHDPAVVADLFEQQGLRKGWSPSGLIAEVALLEGYPLEARAEQCPEFLYNTVYRLTAPDLPALLACFDAEVDDATVEALGAHRKAVFVCLDRALDDARKLVLRERVTRLRTL